MPSSPGTRHRSAKPEVLPLATNVTNSVFNGLYIGFYTTAVSTTDTPGAGLSNTLTQYIYPYFSAVLYTQCQALPEQDIETQNLSNYNATITVCSMDHIQASTPL